MAQMCPAWGTFVPFKTQLYRKGSDITNYWCYFRREAGGSDLINHIPLSAWLRHQSKVLIDSLEISKMCCCVEDLKRFIVNLPCCLGQGCCHN